MRKQSLTYILTIIALLGLCTASYAQATKIITLKDGSTLKGKVLQLSDNVYTLETTNLGQISIAESEILSIASPQVSSQAVNQASDIGNEVQKTNLKKQVEQIQGTIMADPAIMMEIQGMLEDESVRAMLADPNLISDVQSFDQDKIEQNDNVQNLMQNPKMQELMNKIQQKIPTQ